MASRTVTDPQGQRWRVKTKWLPRRVRWRGKDVDVPGELLEGVELLSVGDDLAVLGVIAAALGALIAAVLLVLFVVPAVIFVIELLVVVLLVALGATGRVVLGRPWTVEARLLGTDTSAEWKVRGWRASSAKVTEIARQIEAGHTPPTTDGVTNGV